MQPVQLKWFKLRPTRSTSLVENLKMAHWWPPSQAMSILSLSYHRSVASSLITPVPGKRHRCLRSGFPPAKRYAMQWRCSAATSPLVQRTPCHLPALRHRWAERFWPGRVGRKRRCWEIRHGQALNKQSRGLRPTCQLLDLLQTKNINSWQRNLVYKMFETL